MKNQILEFFKFSYGSLISAGISFLSTPIITYLINPSEFGRATVFTICFSILITLIQLGTDQSFVRFFNGAKRKNDLSSLLANSLIYPSLILLVFIFLILIFGKYLTIQILGINDANSHYLLLFLLCVGLFERFATLLIRMQKRAVLFSNLKMIQATTNVIVVISYAKFIENSFYALIIANIVSLLLVLLIGIYKEKDNWIGVIFKLKLKKSRNIILYGLPFIPSFLASSIFEGVDKIILNKMTDFTEVGLYSAASKIVAFLTLFQIMFSNYWAPISYEAYEKDKESSKLLFRDVFNLLAPLLIIGAFSIILTKDLIINLFGNEYRESAQLIPFLVFMPVFLLLSEITVAGINFSKHTYLHIVISVLSALINLILLLILVPKIGAVGAAISNCITYLSFFVLRTYFSNRYFKVDYNFKKFFRLAVLLFLCAIFNTFLGLPINPWLVNSILFLLLLTLTRDEIFMGITFIKTRIR